MRVLLIQAISTHDGGEVVFPLGLARLAAVIGGRHEVRGLDLNFNPFPWPDLVRTLDDFRPQVVGVSFRNLDPLAGNLLSFVPHLKTLAALLKKHAAYRHAGAGWFRVHPLCRTLNGRIAGN